MEILSTIAGIIGTILASAWSLYTTLLQVPVINVLVLVGTAIGLYLLHRKLPQSAQRQIGGRIGPSLWLLSRPFRWPLGSWLISDQPAGGTAKVVEKVVKVPIPARMSFRAWLASGIKWGLFWGFLALLIYEYQVILTLFTRAV